MMVYVDNEERALCITIFSRLFTVEDESSLAMKCNHFVNKLDTLTTHIHATGHRNEDLRYTHSTRRAMFQLTSLCYLVSTRKWNCFMRVGNHFQNFVSKIPLNSKNCISLHQ